MINLEKFKKMTDRQKYNLLKGREIKIISQQFMDGNAKVGDPNAVRTGYQARIENIALTGWKLKQEDALKEGAETLESLNEL